MVSPSKRKARTMQQKILQGLPFWADSETKQIYAFEKPQPPLTDMLCLGTYDPKTEQITLLPNWRELYQPRLDAYRAVEKPRQRKKVP